MAIWSNMRARVLSVKVAFARDPATALCDYFTPRAPSPPARNAADWTATYGKSPRLASVSKIATDLAGATGKLYSVSRTGDRKQSDNHPFLQLLRQPNPLPQMTSVAIWRLMTICKLVIGESYAIIERDKRGMPVELWPIPPHWVQETPCAGRAWYTVRNRDGQPLIIPIEDMYTEIDLNPLDPYGRGLGQAQGVADEIETDEYAAKFSKKFFFNDATSGSVILATGVDEEQSRRFLADWNSRYRGAGNAHKLGILPFEGASIARLGDSPKEMDYVSSRMFLRDTVNQHFGMPPEIMGITVSSNRATSENAKAIYAENVLSPQLIARQDAINQQLLSAWNKTGALIWEYDDVVPEDAEFQANVIGKVFSRGAVMRNEYREAIGLDADANGDVYYVPSASGPYGAHDNMTAPILPSFSLPLGDTSAHTIRVADMLSGDKTGTQDRQSNGFSRHHRQCVKQRMAREQMGMRKACAAMLRKHMDRQADAVLHALDGQKADDGWYDALLHHLNAGEPTVEEAANRFVAVLLRWPEQNVQLERAMRPIWEAAYAIGQTVAKDLYGIPTVQNSGLTQALREHGLERVKAINQTTRERLAQELADGVEAGESQAQLVDRVHQTMGEQRARAEIIADTQVHTSIQSGNYSALRNSGARTKTWLSSRDSATRDTHRELDGRTIPMDEKFANGLLYPGDPSGSAGEIINCRCDIVPGEDDDVALTAWDEEQRRLDEIDGGVVTMDANAPNYFNASQTSTDNCYRYALNIDTIDSTRTFLSTAIQTVLKREARIRHRAMM